MIEKINNLLNSKRIRYAWILGGAIWLAWLVNFIGGKGILDLAGNNKGADFICYYATGKIILMGKITELYSLDLMNSVQQSIYQSTSPGFYPFLYPPQYALFVVPFSLLPYTIAYLLWIFLGILSLWISIRCIRIQKPLHLFLFSLTWFPVFTVVSFGLNSFFSLLIFCLTYFFWSKNKNLFAGLIFSIVLFKPQFLVFIGILWLLDWRKSWKALLGLGFGVLFQIGFLFAFFPQLTLTYIEFAKTIIPKFMFIKEFPIWNSFSVLAFWRALLPNHADLSQFLFLLCSVLISVFLWKIWVKFKSDRALTFSTAVLWLVCCIPYIFVYDWILLLIPAIILWNHLREFRSTWRVVFAILWIAGLISSPLAYLQLKILPFAVQIAIPALFGSIILIYRVLINQHAQPSTNSASDQLA